jgi:hypothetical protein
MGRRSFDGTLGLPTNPAGRGGAGRGGRPPVAQLPRYRRHEGGGAKGSKDRDREPEMRKTASGATPGGLRIRLLMKETVRGPLGGSLLLGIHARIERERSERRERERERRGCEDGDVDGRAIGPMRLARAPRTFRISTALPTEHGQARALLPALRFHRDVLKREDHGTVAASLSGCGLHWFRFAAGRRSGRKRHSTCSSRSGVAQEFNAVHGPNQRLDETNIKRASFVPSRAHLPRRALMLAAGAVGVAGGAGCEGTPSSAWR